MKLTLPQPCSESWDAMIPEQTGKYCSSCHKLIPDFTHYSDRDLIHYLQRHSGEKVCGRFLPSQLNRSLLVPTPTAPSTGISLASLVLLAASFTANPAYGQMSEPPQLASLIHITEMYHRNKQLILSGNLKDSLYNEPLPFFTILLKHHEHILSRAQSDITGHFEMYADTTFEKNDSLYLEITGDFTATIPLDILLPQTDMEITISAGPLEDQPIIGMLVITNPKKKQHKRFRWFRRR